MNLRKATWHIPRDMTHITRSDTRISQHEGERKNILYRHHYLSPSIHHSTHRIPRIQYIHRSSLCSRRKLVIHQKYEYSGQSELRRRIPPHDHSSYHGAYETIRKIYTHVYRIPRNTHDKKYDRYIAVSDIFSISHT
jgi:hypothetical protein